MIPAMPIQRPAGPEDVTTFRCMARAEGNSGYLFFNNYQRYVTNQHLNNIQVQVKLAGQTVTIPSKPITIPKDCCGIWPLHLNINGTVLEYATAQLFARISGDKIDTYFFFAQDGLKPEFTFQGQDPQVIEPGLGRALAVSGSNKPTQICVLPQQQALRATRHQLWNKTRLVLTDGAETLTSPQGLHVLSTGRSQGSIWTFPPMTDLNLNGCSLTAMQEGLFSRFDWSVKRVDIDISWRKLKSPDATQYALTIPSNALDGIDDLYLNIDHVCDYLTVSNGERLIGDWYYLGKPYRPSIRHWGKEVLSQPIMLELTALTAEAPCFIEERYCPDFNKKPAYAEIRDIKAVPLYRVVLQQH
jgi:hypothetical protein